MAAKGMMLEGMCSNSSRRTELQGIKASSYIVQEAFQAH
jgi:hypothetical protein